MNLDLFIIILLSNNCFPNRMHARPLILPHAPNPRPHIQLGMFAIVIRIPLSPTRIRFIRIFHAFFQRPLFFRDAISFLHADQEGQRGFAAFCWLIIYSFEFSCCLLRVLGDIHGSSNDDGILNYFWLQYWKNSFEWYKIRGWHQIH